MRIQITRRGGLAGIPLSAELDTGALQHETAAEVEQAVHELLGRGDQSTTPPHPDAFEYEIAVPGGGASARVSESELPPQLRPLLQELVSKGTLGTPERRRPS
jgi:hypothetical protein